MIHHALAKHGEGLLFRRATLSHVVTIQAKVSDVTAIEAACRRLSLAAPVHGTAKLFSGEIRGFIVQLPGWEYPAVIDTESGTVQFDNYEGKWGDQKELDRFVQIYTVEKTKIEARRRGHAVSEQLLQDGSIRVQIATV
jgi:hypothetical protein